MDTEQGSLSMLFKGITFTATIENKERVYRPKTSEEETWFDWIKEGCAMSGQKGALYYKQYPASKLSLETKKITTKISFPKNFSGSLELKALDEKPNKVFIDFIYLFDDEGNVARVSLINEFESIHSKNDKNILNFINKRLRKEKDWTSIRDGQELWYNIQDNKMLRIDEIVLNTRDKSYPFFTEEFSLTLTEENTNNNIMFYLLFKSNNEIINQNYSMVLNLGSDRKN